MTEQEPKGWWARWAGEKRIVRLMLLAAALTLGVIHIEWLVQSIFILWQIARPLISGAVLAYILEIVIKRLEKLYFPHSKREFVRRTRRWVCILLAAALIFSLAALIVMTVIPGLTEAFTVIAREMPVYFEQAKEWMLENSKSVPVLEEAVKGIELDWQSVQQRVVDFALNGVGGRTILSSTVTVISAVTSHVANFFISVIFSIFLLYSKEKLRAQRDRLMRILLRPDRNEKFKHVLQVAHRCFSGFIVGQSLNGLILGLGTWVGMVIFRMPYALIVGVLSGTSALIPIIGGYIGALLGTFLVFTAEPGMAIWFLLFIVVLQTVSGNLVYPRLVGSSVGLPGLWVLAAVTVGGGIGGIGGMLIGVPLAGSAYALIQEWALKKEEAAKKTDALP